MPRQYSQASYQAVAPSRRSEARSEPKAPAGRVVAASFRPADKQKAPAPVESFKESVVPTLKRGHTLSYLALFTFTLVLYARPSDFYPSPITANLALVVAIITLAFFIPTQLSLEGTFTARPREVNLVLILALTGLLSVPLAIDPAQAWQEFSGTFIRCIVIFIVMVNVVRTEARLRGLLLLGTVTGVWLSLGAINDYRLGLMTVEGYRAGGIGGGIFGNSNDMALFLITLVPITIALLLRSRNLALKVLGAACTFMMIVATVLTYSRGAFLGLVISLGFMFWRISPNRKFEMLLIGILLVAGVLLIAPGGYARRLASIIFPALDPVGSSDARRGELMRSLYVALRHPLLGIGMGNYQTNMSYRGLVTHNSYTQVAAEMGMTALVCYTMFIVAPFRKMGQIAREMFGPKSKSSTYYLAVGLQASLLAYLVASFFASVAYLWYVYYLVAYAVCFRRIYEAASGKAVVVEKKRKKHRAQASTVIDTETRAVTP
jgi:putative inorganic carbon (hco3(-)) transporter